MIKQGDYCLFEKIDSVGCCYWLIQPTWLIILCGLYNQYEYMIGIFKLYECRIPNQFEPFPLSN